MGSHVHALVLSTDMASIKEALKRGDTGVWQDFFREIMGKSEMTLRPF